MPGFLQRFMPRDGDFFVLFRKQAENIVSGANAFTSMLEHYTGVPEQVQRVKAIEHQGDEITHQIFRKLNQTFITPFDREDMHELCGTMDDVIDLIDAAASRFVLYRIDRVRSGTIELTKVLAAATVVSTVVLTPFRAVLWAAFWNFIAAFVFGTAVAKTIGSGMVHIQMVNEKVLLAGLLGAISWNLITLTLGLPSSSSHALMGGYGGAAVAHAGFKALILAGWTKPVLFIFLSPVIGMLLAILITLLTSWIVRRQRPYKWDQWFRRLQLFSAALFSLGHGTNDSQKGMGIITTVLVAGGLLKNFSVPFWVIICCHLAMAGGTMAGGWRIIKTMGQRITKLTPFGGFAAETAGGITIVANAVFGIPVSTTHAITGAIVGVVASRRLTAVRWSITRHILRAWILTIPGAALLGAGLYEFLAPLLK